MHFGDFAPFLLDFEKKTFLRIFSKNVHFLRGWASASPPCLGNGSQHLETGRFNTKVTCWFAFVLLLSQHNWPAYESKLKGTDGLRCAALGGDTMGVSLVENVEKRLL